MKKALLVLAMVLLSTAAWGETKYSLEELQNLERNLYPNKSKALNQPWGDSRYRLEKNEVTGHYRIMENVNGKWQVVIRSWSGSDLGSSPSDHYYTEKEMDYHLNGLRKREQEDKAWRPIK